MQHDVKLKTDAVDSSDDEATSEERKQGLAAFRQIDNVVCLNRVVRAPNALGALCTCIRHCVISDDVWALLQSLVLRSDDPRLRSSKWSSTPLKLIVQRHLLRVSMSDTATLHHAEAKQRPVYICAARDDVLTYDPEVAKEIQTLLQNKANYRDTGRRQSVLLLYEGCRMILDGKTCSTLGLMNGTEVVIEHILLHDDDRKRWTSSDATVLRPLTHMPQGLIVRAPHEKWVLPECLLPGLPPETPLHRRRGLFLICPSASKTFTLKHQGTKLRVKRTQFSLVPGNAVIVYGAQGESYDCAIADLGVPPGQDVHLYWLAMYVMLTRCKSLDGILLLRLPSRQAFEAGAPEYIKKEITRLASLHTQTMKRLQRNLTDVLGALPQKVNELFVDADTDSTQAAVLRQEIENRQLAAGLQAGRRLSRKTSCLTPKKSPPRRCLLKRETSAASPSQLQSAPSTPASPAPLRQTRASSDVVLTAEPSTPRQRPVKRTSSAASFPDVPSSPSGSLPALPGGLPSQSSGLEPLAPPGSPCLRLASPK